MKRLVVEGLYGIPDGVQNAMRYAAAHQWQAFVKQNGAVAAFQQLRRLGGQTSVRFLVDLLAPGIITAEGYVWLAFALKYGSCLSHTMLQGLATAKHVEVVQERTRALTDIQLDDDGSQALEQVRVQETGDVVKYFYWWQLRVVAAKEHKVAMERELGQHVQERGLCHEYLVNAKRAVEESLLDPVLQPRECFGGIELATRNVSTSSHCTVDEFETLLDQSAFPTACASVYAEGPLFCAELQSQLLDITLSFTEDFNGWHEVWATSGLLVEEDAILLLDGQLAVEDSKDLPLSRAFFQEPVAENRLGTVQRLTTNLHEKVFGLFRLFLR